MKSSTPCAWQLKKPSLMRARAISWSAFKLFWFSEINCRFTRRTFTKQILQVFYLCTYVPNMYYMLYIFMYIWYYCLNTCNKLVTTVIVYNVQGAYIIVCIYLLPSKIEVQHTLYIHIFIYTAVVNGIYPKEKLKILILWTYLMYILASRKCHLNSVWMIQTFLNPFSTLWKCRIFVKIFFLNFLLVLKTKICWCQKFLQTKLIVTAWMIFEKSFGLYFLWNF